MIQRVEGGTTSNFIWDGWDLIREQKSGTVTETTNYLCPHGEVLAFQRDGDWFYLHGDALSSTQLVTDENGAVVGRYVYGAWGDELSATESVPGLFENRFFGGLGCRRDSATGLIYMRNRWYDCQLQRFISRDPMSFGIQTIRNSGEQDVFFRVQPGQHRQELLKVDIGFITEESNAYTYGANSPINKVDPEGLAPIMWTPPPLPITDRWLTRTIWVPGGRYVIRLFIFPAWSFVYHSTCLVWDLPERDADGMSGSLRRGRGSLQLGNLSRSHYLGSLTLRMEQYGL